MDQQNLEQIRHIARSLAHKTQDDPDFAQQVRDDPYAVLQAAGLPDEFVPERWITGNAEEQGKNWLVFGTGPHYCLGQNYAILNLMLLIHKLSAQYDWKHTITPKSEEIKVFATIFPMDDLLLKFSRRNEAVAA